MQMKYFRFLYGETRQCLVHFGELQDTKTDESFRFLYLRKVKKHVQQKESEHTLFLYPEHVNLVVLGRADAETINVLKEMLKGTKIDTLIIGAKCDIAKRELLPDAGEVISLSSETYQKEAAGWRFLMKSCADGSIAMAHGLIAETAKGMFNDCVMNVKALGEETQCQKETSPDGYGCALGCVLHRDYDVCKYHGTCEMPVYNTGTILFGGEADENSCKELLKEARQSIGEIRFFGLGSETADSISQESKVQDGFRRYFVGAESELNDKTIADICRCGWHQIPVVLKKGKGICCAGLLKYTE